MTYPHPLFPVPILFAPHPPVSRETPLVKGLKPPLWFLEHFFWFLENRYKTINSKPLRKISHFPDPSEYWSKFEMFGRKNILRKHNHNQNKVTSVSTILFLKLILTNVVDVFPIFCIWPTYICTTPSNFFEIPHILLLRLRKKKR